MRVEIVYADSGNELTAKTNLWLELNEEHKVILSISPVSAHPKGGGYITITYTDKEKVFEKIQ